MLGALAVATVGLLLGPAPAGAHEGATPASPNPSSADVLTVTRVDGVDSAGHFSVMTRTVGGVPVLPGRTLAAAAPSGAQNSGLARLAGASRYETAVIVSRRAFSAGSAGSVYLARGDQLGDALAGGSLSDGPVLLVPPVNGHSKVPGFGQVEVPTLCGVDH